MPELVKQRGNFIVSEQRRCVLQRRRKVACKERHRPLHTPIRLTAHPAIRHPGTAALVGTREQIEIKAGDVLAIIQRSEEHTSELQSRGHLVCRLLLEKK